MIYDEYLDKALLKRRFIFLFNEINDEVVEDIIKKIIFLDTFSQDPITIIINSQGGDVQSGMALIDAMEYIKSPIVTVINGMAASMAGIVSVCGDKKFMTTNSYWMAHEGYVATADYTSKIKCNMNKISKQEEVLTNILKSKTKLTTTDLSNAKNGELWLTAEECVAKGVVDSIIKSISFQKVKHDNHKHNK